MENENVGIENIEEKHIGINSDIENEQKKIKPPTPIFVREILDYPALRTHFIKRIGANKFFVKSVDLQLMI